MDGSDHKMDTTYGVGNISSAVGSMMSLEQTPDPSIAGASGQTIKRRSGIACRRCRRMRSKCIHVRAIPPCDACRDAGIPAEECEFPVRGQPDKDREYRHPRMRADKKPSSRSKQPAAAAAGSSSSSSSLPAASNSSDIWDELPPLEHLVDGVNRFTRYYFQLGFLNKIYFPQKLINESRTVEVFLLLSILSISARLSPKLRERFGSGIKAAEFFMDKAQTIAHSKVYVDPTLEICQAFYLLSIAQQGSGDRVKSSINMGIAVRMATLMMLHREETFALPRNATRDMIIRAESARRTIWMLHSQDSLHSGPHSPVSLAATDLTTLLPCDEEDFAAGRRPKHRSTLAGDRATANNLDLSNDPDRSLFASLIQLHHLWGTVSRNAVAYSKQDDPGHVSSDYSQMAAQLAAWESSLPRKHTWDVNLFRQYKAAGEDLAYLCVTMMTRLCNIVIRRPFLQHIIVNNTSGMSTAKLFTISQDLFRNVRHLFIQIDAQFTDRTPDESVGAQIAAFCVYSCGLFATYIWKYPKICKGIASAADGEMILKRTITILTECKDVWPLANRWVEALEKAHKDPTAKLTEGSMADGKDPIPHALQPPHKLPPLKQTVSVPKDKTTRILPLPGTQPSPPVSSNMPSTQTVSAFQEPVNVSQAQAQIPEPFPATQHRNHPAPAYPAASLPLQQEQPLSIPPQQQLQQQQLQQQPVLLQQHSSLLAQTAVNQYQPLNQAQQFQQQFNTATNESFFPQQTQATIQAHPTEGLGGMLLDPYVANSTLRAQQNMDIGLAQQASVMGNPFYPQADLINDGFENELQFYIDGIPPSMQNGIDPFPNPATF